MASLKDIAQKCGVSVASVSKALNGYTDIGEETRNLILRTAAEMGYLPNASAVVLKTKKSHNLTVVMNDEAHSGLTHAYFNQILQSFRTTAEKRGYDITFTSRKISGMDMTYYEHCRYRGADGVAIVCENFYSDQIQQLIRSDIPIVTIDHVFDGRLAVVSNNIQGMEELVSYVCKKGHQRIAYVYGQDNAVTRSRLSAFYRTMQRYGLKTPDEYMIESEYLEAEEAEKATDRLLSMDKPPTCIFYSDDLAAIGGINAIRRRGLRIPEDISIVGYDGNQLAQTLQPKLTTMCQDTKVIGTLAAEKLIDLIEHPKTALVDKFTVDGILFTGASVKDISKGRFN